MRRTKRGRKTGRIEQGDMAHMIDNLAEFEEFREAFLPAIQKDLRAGLSAKEIREKYQAYLQARVVQIGLMEPDSGKALSAIKDLLDRSEGRAVERRAVAHKFESMDDRELDSLLVSKMKAANLLESGEDTEPSEND